MGTHVLLGHTSTKIYRESSNYAEMDSDVTINMYTPLHISFVAS